LLQTTLRPSPNSRPSPHPSISPVIDPKPKSLNRQLPPSRSPAIYMSSWRDGQARGSHCQDRLVVPRSSLCCSARHQDPSRTSRNEPGMSRKTFAHCNGTLTLAAHIPYLSCPSTAPSLFLRSLVVNEDAAKQEIRHVGSNSKVPLSLLFLLFLLPLPSSHRPHKPCQLHPSHFSIPLRTRSLSARTLWTLRPTH
jgi:hypothetical protein